MDYLDAIYKQTKKVVNAGVGGVRGINIYAGFHYATGGTGGEKGAINRGTAFLSGFPVIGDAIRQVEKDRMISDYLRNKGMTWADVEYPGLIGYGLSGGVASSGWDFISSNIEDLYEERPPTTKNRSHVNPGDFFR